MSNENGSDPRAMCEDFSAFLADWTKTGRSVTRARHEPEKLCQLLREFQPQSLRLVGYCLKDDGLHEIRAVLLDDLDARTARRIKHLEKVVQWIHEAEIDSEVRWHARNSENGPPDDPCADVRPIMAVSLDAYLLASNGVPMGYLLFSDVKDEMFSCRESLSDLTQIAGMVVSRIGHSYKMLSDLGVDLSQLSKDVLQQQRATLVLVLRRVHQCSDILTFDWKELLSEADDDE